MKRVVAVVLLAAAVTACATVPNPISQVDRESLSVKSADLNWEVDDSKRAPSQAFELDKQNLEGLIHNDVMQQFADEPHGATPVAFKIHITRYFRVNAFVGNVVGGANSVVADVDVVRESDGKVLGVYNSVYGMYASNHGLIGAIAQGMMKPDIINIMAETLAENLRQRYDGKASFPYTAKPTRHLDANGVPTPAPSPAVATPEPTPTP